MLHDMPEEQQRWFAVKIFERDEQLIEKLNISKDKLAHIEQDIKACEKEMDDDSQSIITSARYTYIASIIDGCVKKSNRGMSTSDKIDRVLTNRTSACDFRGHHDAGLLHCDFHRRHGADRLDQRRVCRRVDSSGGAELL